MSAKVVSILGCGWLGKPLGKSLADAGYVVWGSTTKNENVEAIVAAGILPFVFKVDEMSAENTAHPFFNSDVLVISLPHRVRAGKSGEYPGQIQAVMDRAHRGNVKNIILISTTSVYPNLNRVVTEDDADVKNPIVQGEKIVRESGIQNTILRLAGLFGPGRRPGRFLAGKQSSGGNTPVSLVHLDDCIQIIRRVIENNVWNEVLNACSDDHPTRRAFYTSAAVELGLEPPVFSDDHETDFKIVSNERLKEVLNYSFIHRLS